MELSSKKLQPIRISQFKCTEELLNQVRILSIFIYKLQNISLYIFIYNVH